MAQETVVDFSVIKQKIIKTDEILRIYQETSNKLKKAQQAYKEMKLKYDQAIVNLNRLQLENERCTFNLDNMKLNKDGLEQQNKKLVEQITLLEDTYNKQTIQSQLEIKKLEEELNNLQEVKINIKSKKKPHCNTEDNVKKIKFLERKMRELEDSAANYKKEIEELTVKNQKLTNNVYTLEQYSDMVKRLEIENKNLLAKLEYLNNQVEGSNGTVKKNNNDNTRTFKANLNFENEKEISELKKNISCLTLDKVKLKTVEEENEKLKQQLMHQEILLFNSVERKSTSNFSTQTEKNDQGDNEKLKLNTEKQHNEIIELRKKVSNLILDNKNMRHIQDENQKLTQQLMTQNLILSCSKEKATIDSCIQTDVLHKNKQRSRYVQTLESIRTYKLQEKLCAENQTLKQSIIDYKTKILDLKAKLELNENQDNDSIRIDLPNSNVESVENILKEMCIPRMLSPMLIECTPTLEDNLDHDITIPPLDMDSKNTHSTPKSMCIPRVIITPPTPTIESVSAFQNDQTSHNLPKNEGICQQNVLDCTDKVNIRNSRKSNDKLIYFKKVPKKRKYRSPFVNTKFIRSRRNYLKRSLLLNKNMLKREISYMRHMRNRKNEDCILKAMQTLTQSKINFTISNESTLSKYRINNDCLNEDPINKHLNMPPSQLSNSIKPKLYIPGPKYRNTKYMTETLNCNSRSCSNFNTYMLLNKQNTETELLGFFSIKDENISPSSSRVDTMVDNVPLNVNEMVRSTINNNIELTPEKLLDTLANLVSMKLKQMSSLKKGRSTTSDTTFDSFNSETETEIERLFEKPTYDILKRNKILLKKARQEKRSTSTTSLEERGEIDNTGICSGDTCNGSSETMLLNLPYTATANAIEFERNKLTDTYEPNILNDVNTNENISHIQELTTIGRDTEDSCDSLHFSACPELLSPLSTIWSPNYHNSYINENLHTSCKSECPHNMSSGILYLRSSLNEDTSPAESNQLLNDRYSHNAISKHNTATFQKDKITVPSEINDVPLEDKLEIQNIQNGGVIKDKVFFNMNDFYNFKENENKVVSNGHQSEVLHNLSPKQLLSKESSVMNFNSTMKENIPMHIPTDENCKSDCSLPNCNMCRIPAFPQSPLHEGEEFINPIIIPLEESNNRGTTNSWSIVSEGSCKSYTNEYQKEEDVSANDLISSSDHIYNSSKCLKQERPLHITEKSISATSISEPFEKLGTDDSVKSVNETSIVNISMDYYPINSDCNTTKLVADNLESNNLDFSSKRGHTDQNYENPSHFFKGDYNEKASILHSSLEDHKYCLPVNKIQTEKSKFNKPIKDLTRDILDTLSNIDTNNDNLPSCLQSPDNSIDEVNFIAPKIIPLDNLRIQGTSKCSSSSDLLKLGETEAFSKHFSENEKHINQENISLNTDDILNNQITEKKLTLSRKRKFSLSTTELRRSTRTSNRANIASEPNVKKDSNITDQIPTVKYKGLYSSIKELQVLDSLNSSSETEVPVKRRRGRPRKQPNKETNTENVCQSVARCREPKILQNKTPTVNTNLFSHDIPRTNEIPLDENIDTSDAKLIILEDSCMNEIESNKDNKQNETKEEGISCNDPLSKVSTYDVDEINDRKIKRETANRNTYKRKTTMSKLKSNVLKQFKEKKKMFQTHFEIDSLVNKSNICDVKINLNESNLGIKESVDNNKLAPTSEMDLCISKNCGTEQKSSRTKICIVQNILIPANSSCAVDLLKEEECKSDLLALNCDIRLDNPHTSSQNNFPIKVGYVESNLDVSVNQDNDILSKIMKEMDKDKPTTSNAETKPCKSKENIHTSISDAEWRKCILEIAESTYNIPTDESDTTLNIKHSLIKNPRKHTASKKEKILMGRLMKLVSDEKIADEIILEFKRQSVDNITEIILHKVIQDTADKAEDKYYPAPLMTKTQRILLNLMVRLESENVENVMDTFLAKAEHFLFKIGCGIRPMVPVTRLYMAICRLRANVNRMRMFCCNAFLFMGDLAVPLLFIVLTSWIEILPMESDLKFYPITKTLVQVVHLKDCKRPGYNLLPLRILLHQFYGYPKERWNCDEMFEELFQQYLSNPTTLNDLAIRLLCKNKDTKWVYKKLNEFLKPLVYKIPVENTNFRATAIILIGKICKHFKPQKELDETYLNDLRRWLNGLIEGDEVSDIIERSVTLSLSMLPKKKLNTKKGKKKKVTSDVKNVKING